MQSRYGGSRRQTQIRLCVHCDHDLGDMALGQGHDTQLGHGLQWHEILYKSNTTVVSYGPENGYSYVWSVTFTFEIWPWVKVMTHPWYHIRAPRGLDHSPEYNEPFCYKLNFWANQKAWLSYLWDHEHFMPTKFRKHPLSGSVVKADCVFPYINMHMVPPFPSPK